MTQHTDLIDEQTKTARWLDEVRQYLTAAADSSMSRNNSEQLAYELLEALPANALEAQAREIAELKAQETELCTLYGLAQAECKKLRAEVDGLRAARMAYASEFPPDGEGEPDVGSIHQNIRAMKAEIDRLRKDAERYKFLRKCHWTDSPPTYVVTTLEGLKLNAMTYSDDRLDEVLDARVAANSTAKQKGQP